MNEVWTAYHSDKVKKGSFSYAYICCPLRLAEELVQAAQRSEQAADVLAEREDLRSRCVCLDELLYPYKNKRERERG